MSISLPSTWRRTSFNLCLCYVASMTMTVWVCAACHPTVALVSLLWRFLLQFVSNIFHVCLLHILEQICRVISSSSVGSGICIIVCSNALSDLWWLLRLSYAPNFLIVSWPTSLINIPLLLLVLLTLYPMQSDGKILWCVAYMIKLIINELYLLG